MVVLLVPVEGGFRGEKQKKNTFFRKQTGEVIDNTGSAPKNKPEQTEKQSGEAVENTFLLKNKPKNKPGHLIENK
jgi:hypothetical protein